MTHGATKAPTRRPAFDCPRVPRPSRRLRGRSALEHGFDRLNRAASRGRIGARIRSRMRAALRFPEHEVPLARAGPGLDGLRLAFLSDLHAGTFMEPEDVVALFARLDALAPDLVCLGGDLVNSSLDDLAGVASGLSCIDPPLGVFAVPGNHDHVADPRLELWSDVLEHSGVVVLRNESCRVERDGAGLHVAGVEDFSCGEPEVEKALAAVPESEPVVLLSHHPDLFLQAAHLGADLTLSGHTHGGQVAPLGRLLGHSRLGFWRGHFERDGARLFVGCGAGVTLLPLRIGAPAEVPLLRLSTRV